MYVYKSNAAFPGDGRAPGVARPILKSRSINRLRLEIACHEDGIKHDDGNAIGASRSACLSYLFR